MIGAPFCEGQNLAGADLGPTAIREAGLKTAVTALGWQWADMGDLDFASHFRKLGLRWGGGALGDHHHSIEIYRQWLRSGMRDNFTTWVNQQGMSSTRDPVGEELHSFRKPKQVVNVELMGAGLQLVHDAVLDVLNAGSVPLTIGGDHSIAGSTISALHSVYPDLGVIWIDAHADANTPQTSPSMHYHGMPAAHLLGWFEEPLPGFDWLKAGCLSEQRLAYIGLRDIDAEERRMLRESSVTAFTMRDVDKLGIAKVVEMALQAVDPNRNRPLHVTLDVDGIDPQFAPGTGTCARGGLSYREVHYICEELALTERLVGMDLVEVNPSLDPAPAGGKMHGDDPSVMPASPTVQLGVELVLSALGKTIL